MPLLTSAWHSTGLPRLAGGAPGRARANRPSRPLTGYSRPRIFARRVRSAFEDGRDPRTVVTAEEAGIVAGVEWGSRTGPGITPGMAHKAQVNAWQSWKRHFGNLRGRDQFKHHDVAVVAGRLEPSIGELERMTRAMFGDEAGPIAPGEHGGTRYPTERRRYRVAGDAAGQAVTVSVHPDPRAQVLLEQVRERELEQAVARLRLVHRNRPATVYLLTNLPLNLEIAELTTWNALARDREAEACRRWDGLWLCSASARAKAAPDLWPSAGAEKQYRRRKKWGYGVLLENILERFVPTFRLIPAGGTSPAITPPSGVRHTPPLCLGTYGVMKQPAQTWRPSPAR